MLYLYALSVCCSVSLSFIDFDSPSSMEVGPNKCERCYLVNSNNWQISHNQSVKYFLKFYNAQN